MSQNANIEDDLGRSIGHKINKIPPIQHLAKTIETTNLETIWIYILKSTSWHISMYVFLQFLY